MEKSVKELFDEMTEMFEKMENEMFKAKNNPEKITIVSCIAGCGKSQLVYEYLARR